MQGEDYITNIYMAWALRRGVALHFILLVESSWPFEALMLHSWTVGCVWGLSG